MDDGKSNNFVYWDWNPDLTGDAYQVFGITSADRDEASVLTVMDPHQGVIISTGSLTCFVPGTIDLPEKIVKPQELEGQYIEAVLIHDFCFRAIVELADGSWVMTENVYSNEDEWLRTSGASIEGYWHYETDYEAVMLTDSPRDPENDKLIVRYQNQMAQANPEIFDNEWDVAESPINACWDLKESWQLAPISQSEIERLCGPIPFSQKYILYGYTVLDEKWLMGTSHFPPAAVTSALPENLHGWDIEITNTPCYDESEFMEIWFTRVSHGEIQSQSFCAIPGDYLFLGLEENFDYGEGIWNEDDIKDITVYYIPVN